MYYFIVNYRGGSGRGAKAWKDIRGILKEKHVEYHAWKTKGLGHATKLAAAIVSRYGSRENPIRLDNDDIAVQIRLSMRLKRRQQEHRQKHRQLHQRRNQSSIHYVHMAKLQKNHLFTSNCISNTSILS